jgi:hypothetical protein
MEHSPARRGLLVAAVAGRRSRLGPEGVGGRGPGVTDFVPLGVPYKGAVWSPADFFLAGLVLLWVGAVRYGRSSRCQARNAAVMAATQARPRT